MHDLGLGRHLQRHGLAVDQLDALRRAAGRRTGIRTACRAPASPRRGSCRDRRRSRRRRAAARASPPSSARWCCAPPRWRSQRMIVWFSPSHLHAVDAEIEVVLARRRDGPLVTTSGQVISGAGSPGQQVWTGSRSRSMSAPFSTTSWHGAPALTVFGFIDSTVFASGSSSSASREPRGGSGWRRKASSLADLAQACASRRSRRPS